MMPDFSAWQNTDWAALESMITAAVALLAAGFAWRQVTEAKRAREEQAQPFVVVDFEPSNVWSNLINLVVRNIGRTLARDVSLAFEPALSSTHVKDEWDLNKTTLLREGIPSMPPGKQVTALFDLSHDRFKSGLPMAYEVTVQFSDARGRQQDPLTYKLDLSMYYGLQGVSEYGLHDASKALREIENEIKKWTAHLNGVRVFVHDEDERQRQELAEFERRRAERDDANTQSDPNTD